MINLGRGYRADTHHIAITDEEADLLVNALSCFHQVFEQPGCINRDALEWWKIVAADTRIQLADELATKIAAATKPLLR